MYSTLTRLLLLPLFATLACACGGSAGDSAATSSTAAAPQAAQDTCSLLTADDIQSVIGKAPGARKPNENGCIWPAADGSNESLVHLIVARANVRSYDEYVATLKKEMGGNPSESVHRIDGAGDFAIGFNDMPMVQIYKGSSSGSSFVQVATFRNEEKHALELAKRAFARLN